ncbi:MAG: hypothetical protein WCD21_13000 [Streptomyces sp.]|uniref:hypothetical protein n=1 Tax=Streptomyces anulatus TaxID=1892 RepID=UPI00344667A7
MAIALGLIGAAAEGLLYLRIIAIVVFIAALTYLVVHIRRFGLQGPVPRPMC